MNEYDVLFQDMGKKARQASYVLNRLDEEKINTVLKAMEHAIVSNVVKILDANESDVEAAREAGLSEAMIDRLTLTSARLEEMTKGIASVRALPSPIGKVLNHIEKDNGLVIDKVTVPFGVLLMIYEARPNVTVDATALSIKSGNAVILRGGKEALRTNKILVDLLRQAAESEGVSGDIVQIVPITDRDAVPVLLQQKRYIDVVIPRGSAALINRVVRESLIPVIETGSGICHMYIDKEADLTKALPLVMNAKVQRPSVCNAMETLLLHEDIALDFLKKLVPALLEKNVEIRGCANVQETARKINLGEAIVAATEEDWATEYNDLILSIRIVSSMGEALEHIAEYGTKHSEAIVTENKERAEAFLREVDAACVYVNASTRFTDGCQFGFGAEIGISTQKLHARGPMALPEMTTYKYLIHGEGQIRE